jgi:hypothetical protein
MLTLDKRRMCSTGRILLQLVLGTFIVMGLFFEVGNAEEWEKVNSDGFGDIDNKSSFPMEILNDDLYVGTWNDAGTEIWMTQEGTNLDWDQANVNGFGLPEKSHSTAMEVFNDKLYVGVFNEEGGEVWLTPDGVSWGQEKIDNFSTANTSIRAMSTFAPYGSNQHLYVGTDNEAGMQLWMTGNGSDWVLMEGNAFDDKNNTSAYSMCVFDNYLYLGTANQQGGTQIWSTQGGITWTQANTDGFGYTSNSASYSMCVFKGFLYVGTVNHLTGTQVWRTSDGINWYQSNLDGFGDSVNYCSYSMTVFNNYLYVGTGNEIARVWRTKDGISWEQVNPDGFEDSDNRRVHSLVAFGEYLYAGTGNKNGTEIWRYKAPEDEANNCFFETVLENEPKSLYALRMIRDKILRRDVEGSEYVALYYRYSSEITDIYNSSPEIRDKTVEVLGALLSGIALLPAGMHMGGDSPLTGTLRSLLGAYAKVSSPALRVVLKKINNRLKINNLSDILHSGKMKNVSQYINH